MMDMTHVKSERGTERRGRMLGIAVPAIASLACATQSHGDKDIGGSGESSMSNGSSSWSEETAVGTTKQDITNVSPSFETASTGASVPDEAQVSIASADAATEYEDATVVTESVSSDRQVDADTPTERYVSSNSSAPGASVVDSGVLEAGDGGSLESTPVARVIDVWPKMVRPGDVILVYGENLTPQELVIGGEAAHAACAGDSCWDSSKVVVSVPATLPSGPVVVKSSRELLGSLAVFVLSPYDSVSVGYQGPIAPVVPDLLGPAEYPPISNRWDNECSGPDDRFFFSEGSTVDGVRVFAGVDDPMVKGSIRNDVGLIRLLVPEINAGFVGVFSRTVHSYTSRIVAFPENGGPQLILYRCDEYAAADVGENCPTEVDPLAPTCF